MLCYATVLSDVVCGQRLCPFQVFQTVLEPLDFVRWGIQFSDAPVIESSEQDTNHLLLCGGAFQADKALDCFLWVVLYAFRIRETVDVA